jgi:hypothetical protein
VKHSATEIFWKLYDKLSPEIRKLADKNFALLAQDPKHPSLHFKRIRNDLWSARIGIYYRALAIGGEAGFTWVWIGTHSEYDRIIDQ